MHLTIPSAADLTHLYYELGRLGVRTVGQPIPWQFSPKNAEELLALAADCSRYDPRLFDALVEFLWRSWSTFHPVRLRRAMATMWTPQVFGVLAEFFHARTSDRECHYYYEYLLRGYARVPYQFFFHFLHGPGTASAQRTAEESLAEFRRWGFLATERPIIDQREKTTCGRYEPETRSRILHRLLHRTNVITTDQYLTALDHSISRQQAVLDLRRYPGLQQRGHGRGARWQRGHPSRSPSPRRG